MGNDESREVGENVEIGIGFYKRDQWGRLLETASDRDALEDTYDEWLSVFKDGVQKQKQAGLNPKMVVVDIEELLRFCKENRLENDSETRSHFIALKLQTEGGEPL